MQNKEKDFEERKKDKTFTALEKKMTSAGFRENSHPQKRIDV